MEALAAHPSSRFLKGSKCINQIKTLEIKTREVLLARERHSLRIQETGSGVLLPNQDQVTLVLELPASMENILNPAVMVNSVILNSQATKTDTIRTTTRSMPLSSSIKGTTAIHPSRLEDRNQDTSSQPLAPTSLAPNQQATSRSRAISTKTCSLSRWTTRNPMQEGTL